MSRSIADSQRRLSMSPPNLDFPTFYRREAETRPVSTVSSHELQEYDVPSKHSSIIPTSPALGQNISLSQVPRLKRHPSADSISSTNAPQDNQHRCTCPCPVHGDEGVEYEPMAEQRKLGYLSTSSLIINKMIGSGIFAKPGYVLLNAGGSKGLALIMWTMGGLMTLCGLIIYLEFGAAYPFNGAEIVYVDEAYKRPQYFAVVVSSIMFIMLGHNAANCISFAKLALQAVEPSVPHPDDRLQKFIAFIAITGVCLIHVFSRKIGIWLNNLLAVYKIILVAFICISGFAALAGVRPKEGENLSSIPGTGNYGIDNLKEAWDFKKVKEEISLINYATAVMGVLYSYTGWENANYVLAEVKRPHGSPSAVFKRAALGSFVTVAALYTLANLAYMTVLTTEEMIGPGDITAGKFFTKMFGSLSSRGINSLVCLSILGNILSFVYGHARVKQEIATLGILPFSNYWSRPSPYGTPVGAITLHWLFASALIWAVPADDQSAGYDLTSNLFIYAQSVLTLLVSVGVLLLRYNVGLPKSISRTQPGFNPQIVPWPVLLTLVIVNACLNLGILVFNWFPPPANLPTTSIAWYILPVLATSVIAFGIVYWFFWGKFGEWLGWWTIERVEIILIDGGRDVKLKKVTKGFAKEVADGWRRRVLRRSSKGKGP